MALLGRILSVKSGRFLPVSSTFVTCCNKTQTVCLSQLAVSCHNKDRHSSCHRPWSALGTRPTLYHGQAPCVSVHTRPKFSKVLDGQVDVDSNAFKQNADHYNKVEKKYLETLALAQSGGGEKAEARHVQANKKVLVMERLKMLFDDMDEVLELSTLSGMGMMYGNIHRASLVIMIGKIQGVYCLIAANDATVKAGTMYPITVTKSLRAQEICMLNRIPLLFLVDSGGAFLPLQGDIFLRGGRGFYNQAILNSMDIPVLSVVVGSCTAGAAYVPTMSQENVIVHKIGTIFLAGPPLVLAALRERVSQEDLGGATMHSSVSGCTDHFAATEEEAFETARDVVTSFNIIPPEYSTDYEEPVYSASEIPGLIPSTDQHLMNMHKVLARIVDGSRFQEFKALYGTTLVAGFATICGHLVGVVANNGEMTEEAASKGAHFVQVCSQRDVPIIFLQNSAPDDTLSGTVDQAEMFGNRLRCQARLMAASACAQVPKITVILGNSFGASNYMMGGRSFNPRFLFSWPNARIGIADPTTLTRSIVESKFGRAAAPSSEEVGEFTTKVSETVARETSAVYASANLWDDGIILPQDTRKVLAHCLEVVKQSAGSVRQSDQYGVIRM